MPSVSFAGSIPQHYDRSLGPVIFAPYAEALAERVAASAPARVLETAAGTGVATRKLRDRLDGEAELVATDLNAPMLDVAQGKFADGERVEFRVADACALPYADAAFDAVCCQFGVMFFPDKDKGYAEARRVLKPDGAFVFSVWDSLDTSPATELVTEIAERAFRQPLRFFDTPHGYHALDPIRAALHRAGFERIALDVLPVASKPASFSSLASGLLLGTPFAEQIRSRGHDPASLIEETTAAFESRFGEDGTIPMRAIQVEARRR